MAIAEQPWQRQVFFGEEHMHTVNSFDAFTAGVTQTWEDAYRFAMGEEIELSTTKEKMKRRTPYDFVAITDHAEYFGVLKDLVDPASPLSKSDFAKQLACEHVVHKAFARIAESVDKGELTPPVVAHEDRTPLTGGPAFSELLQQRSGNVALAE